MSDWHTFLDDLGEEINDAWNVITNKPGPVMICFVNRYLEGLDGIQYKIQHGGKRIEAKTTAKNYCVTVTPSNLQPIEVYVWSRIKSSYKKLDDVIPKIGGKRLARKILKTYKVAGKTEAHPKQTKTAAPLVKPAPAPAPGPSPTDKQGVNPTLTKDESGLSLTKVERPVPDKITKEQLKKIFLSADLDHLQKIADELNKDLVKFKLDTPVRRAHFFGQTRQETGTTAKGGSESFNYGPSGLIGTFGYYNKNQERKDEAREDGRLERRVPGKKKLEITQAAKEEVIANKVYGLRGKAKDLGNELPDDGWRFRGRGLKQTTGRGNYGRLTEGHKKYWAEEINFVANPDLVAQFPYTVRSAVVFWLKNECWKAADGGINNVAIDSVTKIINSGEIRNHLAGKYKPDNNPVTNRRAFVNLAYAAFT